MFPAQISARITALGGQKLSPPLSQYVNALEEENATLSAALVKTKRKYKELKKEKLALQENDDKMKEPESDTLSAHLAAMAKSPRTYEQYMAALPKPRIHLRPLRSELLPVFSSSHDVQQVSDIESFPFLSLHRRARPMPGGHFLALGPSHRYDHRSGVWVKGSDLAKYHGSTRELFVDRKGQIGYMGSFKCISLADLDLIEAPRVSKKVMKSLALNGYVPRNREAAIIHQCYPSGTVALEGMALQYVGFNHQLYKNLRERYVQRRGGKKRNAGTEYKKAKRQKVRL
ncbi:hypothetical protein DFH06DRAFT_1246154 [Mycena polygramma]|nr:hypothetical protein DFH06DRAFT_1246154 [Mycena polygramma]